jgi:F420-dependent methylenetetrahydromethanopterin dehydrogenase
MALDAGRELLILGILRRGAFSAYELTRAVKMHGPLYRSLARGNIYEQLAHLEKAGMVVASSETAARGPRKTKTVYRLAPPPRVILSAAPKARSRRIASIQSRDSILRLRSLRALRSG